MSQKFRVPGPLPGINDIIKMAKRHPQAYAKEKRELTNMVRVSVIAAGIQPMRCVSVHMTHHEAHRRRDPDNIFGGAQKFILDGIVAAGVLPADTAKHVRGISHELGEPDMVNPHIMVRLEELAA